MRDVETTWIAEWQQLDGSWERIPGAGPGTIKPVLRRVAEWRRSQGHGIPPETRVRLER